MLNIHMAYMRMDNLHRGYKKRKDMSTEQNKKIALGLLDNLSNGNVDCVLDAMAESATWWAPGVSGTKSKREMGELLKNLGAAFTNGLKITVDGSIAEGDRVAIEAHSYGEMVTGKVYQNQYHFLFEVRDGKVQIVKEYMDTLHVKEAFQS